MPRRRACTTVAVAAWLSTASQPTCSHALVAPRHGALGRARAPIGRRRHRWAPALRRRGGGEDDDDEEEEDEEEDEDDDAHLFDDDMDDEGAVSDADFEGDSLKARARKAWAATPPVTQVYVGSSLALTVGSFLLAGNQWPQWLNLDWKKVMTGQLWYFARCPISFRNEGAMTTYVCRPSRNRYVSSAIFLSFNIRAPCLSAWW